VSIITLLTCHDKGSEGNDVAWAFAGSTWVSCGNSWVLVADSFITQRAALRADASAGRRRPLLPGIHQLAVRLSNRSSSVLQDEAVYEVSPAHVHHTA